MPNKGGLLSDFLAAPPDAFGGLLPQAQREIGGLLGGGFPVAPAPVNMVPLGGRRLRAAAIRVDGKVYRGKTHNEAIGSAEEATGRPIFREYVESGFVNARGRFVPRDDPSAAIDALASGQIKDAVLRELIESSIKRGLPSPLTAEHLDFGP